MAFWKRKREQFVTLGLTEARVTGPSVQADIHSEEAELESPAGNGAIKTSEVPIDLQPAITGGSPTPSPTSDLTVPAQPEGKSEKPTSEERLPAGTDQLAAAAVEPRARSSFSTSILGLDRSLEELQAEEEALDQTFAVRFSRAVAATRETLSERLDAAFQGRKQIDAELLDELEEALIAADIGVSTTLEILENVRRGIAKKEINNLEALKDAIKEQLIKILRTAEGNGVASEESVPANITPYVMVIVGVNGVGKTTTIGKLARRIKSENNDVLICAADTFRAAASDQLAIWAERTGVPLIQQKQGTDPAAVLFDSLKAAKARASDVLIVDTAGRLHTKSNLMSELEKMRRVAGREVDGAPHETLLVIDAVTGQNGLEQARQFLKTAGVTGIVLTKLDGTAKGGIAVAIAKELQLPIRYAGIGEKVDDLVVFDPEQYVNSLFN